MTLDDILAMAREAGFQQGWLNLWSGNFERFAALVAATEREACAQVCEQEVNCTCCWSDDANAAAEHIAAVIRIRSVADGLTT